MPKIERIFTLPDFPGSKFKLTREEGKIPLPLAIERRRHGIPMDKEVYTLEIDLADFPQDSGPPKLLTCEELGILHPHELKLFIYRKDETPLDSVSRLLKKMPPNIRELKLQYCLNDGLYSVSYLAKFIEANPRIRKLDISTLNNIGDRGAIALALVLPKTNLKTLKIGSNGIRLEGLEALLEAIPRTNLTALYISNNQFDARGHLKILDFANNWGCLTELSCDLPMGLPSLGLGSAFANLATNKSLKKLEFQNNGIESKAVLDLASALEKNTALRIFNFIDTFSRIKPWTPFICALKKNINLAEFGDVNTEFNAEDLDVIRKALYVSDKVRKIFDKAPVEIKSANIGVRAYRESDSGIFGARPELEKEVLSIVTEILHANRKDVTTLNLGLIAIIAIGEEAALNLSQVIAANTNLEKLDFQSSVITEAGVQAMLDAAYISNRVREHFHQRPLKVLNAPYPHNLPEERKMELDEEVLNIIKEKLEQDRGGAMDEDEPQQASSAAAAADAPPTSIRPAGGMRPGAPLDEQQPPAKLQRQG